MPKGIPAKKQPVFVEPKVEAKPDVKAKEEVKETPVLKPVVEPLGAGQAYFEAPDGTLITGEANKDQIWYRAGNGGRGMWINRKR